MYQKWAPVLEYIRILKESDMEYAAKILEEEKYYLRRYEYNSTTSKCHSIRTGFVYKVQKGCPDLFKKFTL